MKSPTALWKTGANEWLTHVCLIVAILSIDSNYLSSYNHVLVCTCVFNEYHATCQHHFFSMLIRLFHASGMSRRVKVSNYLDKKWDKK